jgi:hypothetical protein
MSLSGSLRLARADLDVSEAVRGDEEEDGSCVGERVAAEIGTIF